MHDAAAIEADERVGPFYSNAVAPVATLTIEQYKLVAEQIAADVTTDLDNLLPCEPMGDEQACAEAFIDELGPRAYRRQLTQKERDRLIPEPTGEGSLLDNSLVAWGQELSTGSHDLDRQPFVLAGRAGGAIEAGRYLQYTNDGHHRLLISIGRAMGLDITTFGNLDDGKGPLGELGV